eukprot:SAG11_NODE_5800_length_1461_cov_1.095448_1_plen_77_part_00
MNKNLQEALLLWEGHELEDLPVCNFNVYSCTKLYKVYKVQQYKKFSKFKSTNKTKTEYTRKDIRRSTEYYIKLEKK